MKSMRIAGALVLTLAAAAAPAAAQTGTMSEPSMALQLTPQQRTDIYQAVAKNKLRTPPPPETPVTVGAQIPPATELYALPDSIMAEAPSAKFYRYTVAQNRVIIVDPTNLKVIEVIQP
jgi:glucose/arabinose dehydrogenase